MSRRRRALVESPSSPPPAPVEVRRLPTVRVTLAGAQCPICEVELPVDRYATPVRGRLAHIGCAPR